HPDRDHYWVAESIRPKLEIRNRHEFSVGIGGFEFDWERLAFSSPNAARLVGPNGNDLMLPYQHPGAFAGVDQAINVEGGKAEWLYLPISSHLHLRQFGNYRFWLELLDSLGDLHRTSEIGFELRDIESSVAPNLIELRLEARSHSFPVREPISVAVT